MPDGLTFQLFNIFVMKITQYLAGDLKQVLAKFHENQRTQEDMMFSTTSQQPER